MIRSLFMLSACFVAAFSFGQVNEKVTVERRPSAKRPAPAYAIDNTVTLDARAQKHYKPEQVMEMPAWKKHQVNYYYQRSYELVIPAGCDYKAEDFDAALYESRRNEDTPARVNLENACGAYVILHSRQECALMNQKIKMEHAK